MFNAICRLFRRRCCCRCWVWEYKEFSINTAQYHLDWRLNEFGRQGWKVIYICKDTHHNAWTWIGMLERRTKISKNLLDLE